MSQTITSIGADANLRRPRGLKRLAAIVAVAGAATLALSAWSGHGPRGEDGPRHMGPPPMMMGPGALLGLGDPGLFMGPGADHPERMNRRIDHMLDGLNATDAQRAQIKEIVRVASVDLKAQREKADGKALRERSLQLFTAPTIDAAAVESLRQQVEAQRDQSAKRVTQAMIDIGRVLTPQQRATAGQLVRFQGDRFDDEMKRFREQRAEDGKRPDGADRGDRRGGPRPDAPPAPPAQ